MSLPISVILPTRNAMGVVEAHLRASAEWLPHVAQIVVVDSSEDGTLDYLRRHLDVPGAEFYARPRGLYEGWNYGVSRATAEFVYYSTLGDTITLAGLEHLLAVARRHEADITISPPEMFDVNGAPLAEAIWPIHDLCIQSSAEVDRRLTPVEAFILSASYVPSTILGSSASNLYRREFLAAHPFLENWGHCADSPWMMENCLAGNVAFTTRPVARFVIHPKEPTTSNAHVVGMSHYLDMYRRARIALTTSELPDAERETLGGWLVALERKNRLFFERIEANVGYLARRDEKIAELGERVKTARSRSADFEAQLKQSNQKVVDLRRELGRYEQAHRSFLRTMGLYLGVKWSQMGKAWGMLSGRKSA